MSDFVRDDLSQKAWKVVAMARRHGKAARRVAEARFSLSGMVSEYCRLYESTLAAAGVPVPGAAQALSAR